MNDIVVFSVLSGLITLCSILVVCLKNPVSAAVFLIIDLFFLGAVYAFQGADFVAAIQIIVYTGAILVLFLFVIMILNLAPQELAGPRWGKIEKISLAIIVGGFVFIGFKFLGNLDSSGRIANHVLADNTQELALNLFKNYLWPFEIVSMLILLTIIGSIAIASRKKADY